METILKATIRDEKGSPESRRLRTEGLLPAIVYGEGMESTSVYIDAREFRNALKTDAGSNVIVNIELGEPRIQFSFKTASGEGILFYENCLADIQSSS